MTLVARDEVDIVDAQIAFHLNAGVDFVVAMDNGSSDGTQEILHSYARDGYLHLIREDGDLEQAQWVTRLARMAARDFAADWVVNSDVDGFWWPRGGTLREVFASIPARYGCVRAMVRHFVPRPESDVFFADRMTIRMCDPGARSGSPFSALFQTAHRGEANVVVSPGNHHAFGSGLTPLPNWYPIDMLHFPLRSFEQFARKVVNRFELETRRRVDPGPFLTAGYEAHRAGRMREFYDSHVIDDEAVAGGLARKELATDTRLRDVLHELEATTGMRRTGTAALDLRARFGNPVTNEAYLLEFGALQERMDLVTQAERRARDLELRIASLERGALVRLRTRLSRSRASDNGRRPWLTSSG